MDSKMKKSINNLIFLAWIFILMVSVVGFSLPIYGYIEYKDVIDLPSRIIWFLGIYVVSFMIVWGVFNVLKLLNNIKNGNIFTYQNSKILKQIDKKILFTLIFSLILNFVMALGFAHNKVFLIMWVMFIAFLLVAHVLVNPIALLVEKSADMQIEMDLTI